MSNTTSKGKVSKTSPWRRSIDIPGNAENLARAAQVLGYTDITEAADFADPGDTRARKARADIAIDIFEKALERVVESASPVELGERPEPYFERARRDRKSTEIKDQRSAIAEFLGLERPSGKESIVLSEADLVTGAIKAAAALGYPDGWSIDDLIHEGIRRVAQELISNAANETNKTDDAPKSRTSPGVNWQKYQQTLDQLIEDQGTDRWVYRKPYITISTIAGAVQPKTNDVQIRRWIAANDIPTFAPPSPDSKDQTMAGKIVDPKLNK